MSTFFFFNDTATTEIYTLSLHDALPIFEQLHSERCLFACYDLRPRIHPLAKHSSAHVAWRDLHARIISHAFRSEEHTSELQSHLNLVCRLLLEKKKRIIHVVQRARHQNI